MRGTPRCAHLPASKPLRIFQQACRQACWRRNFCSHGSLLILPLLLLLLAVLQVAARLCRAAGVRLEAADLQGRTPLHLAASRGHDPGAAVPRRVLGLPLPLPLPLI